MSKSKDQPVAIIISDVHFNQHTVNLAGEALAQAIKWANDTGLPLVIAGDLNDTKAIIRAECLNRILDELSRAQTRVYVLVGNHDRINEKAEAHSLEFLKQVPGVEVIDEPTEVSELSAYLIPYQHDTEHLRAILAEIPAGSTLIMHQGIRGAFMGEYVVDKSSIEPEALAPFRVISGHYHRAQTIITDGKKHDMDFQVGTFTYIGTPYSITHAEANDGPKGFRIMREKTLSLIPCGLRKHVKIQRRVEDVLDPIEGLHSDDLLWLQVSGPASQLEKLSKKEIGEALIGHQNFKLDLIYDSVELMSAEQVSSLTDEQLLDKIIADSEETPEQKEFLQKLWREIL
jgi:DNA repair exonuclease SbcCD nuclease subunit